MSEAWLTVLLLAAATAAIRAAGPILVGGREPSGRVRSVIALLAPALLAALVVSETLGEAEGGIALDERLAGVAAAGGVLAYRESLLLAIAVAAGVTAAARAL